MKSLKEMATSKREELQSPTEEESSSKDEGDEDLSRSLDSGSNSDRSDDNNGNDHSGELALLENALHELTHEKNRPLPPIMNNNNSTSASVEDQQLVNSLHNDLRHHEEAIQAIQRELARAEQEGLGGSNRSISSAACFRESQRNSERSFASASSPFPVVGGSMMLSGSQAGSERSIKSRFREKKNNSQPSMEFSSIGHQSMASLGSSAARAEGLKSSGNSERSVGDALLGNRSASDRSVASSTNAKRRLSDRGSERSLNNTDIAAAEPQSPKETGNDEGAGTATGEVTFDASQQTERRERRSSLPLLQELKRVPSERFWTQPVTVKKPKTIMRRLRLLCGKVVENPTVQTIIIWLIIINAVIMGIATFDFVTQNRSVERAFEAVDKSFLIVFTLEITMQLMYRGLSLFTDGWLVFDFVIVVTSWSLESLQVIRAFRIFRAFRLITRLGTLRELIMAIGNVMPRIYAIAMLLLLIFYIFAVMFTELFGDLEYEEYNYFHSLDASLFTLMELMTLEWASIARETMAQKRWAWLPFLSFISVTGFIVFNLIVAVVCDAVKVVDQQVKHERELELQGHNGREDTDTIKLQEAQERIYELIGHVEMMELHHRELHTVVTLLANELVTEMDISGRPFHNAAHATHHSPGGLNEVRGDDSTASEFAS